MKPSKTSPNNEPIATMNDANTQSVVDTIIRLADKNDVEILDLASSGKLPSGRNQPGRYLSWCMGERNSR